MLRYSRNYNLYINVEKSVFQRRNNIILSTLNQGWNLRLKQRWFWVETKKTFSLCHEPQCKKLYYTLNTGKVCN